ncbi:hypothetical protein PFISCL1PPCAC_4232, partial [Pristionchus fissidentatus]
DEIPMGNGRNTVSLLKWPLMSLRNLLLSFPILLCSILLWNEYLVYYVKIGLTCRWPKGTEVDALRVFMVSDTHLLGRYRGHWVDKMKREWQMHRSFHTARQLLQPEVAFFLGDLFDEGQWSNNFLLAEYADRFEELFFSKSTRTVVLPGNHDLGFHYAMHPETVRWFRRRYGRGLVDVVNIGRRPFVLITSMALHGDGCKLCSEAEARIGAVKRSRECRERSNGTTAAAACRAALAAVEWPEESLPAVLLQHFPLYRRDESECVDVSESDPERLKEYRDQWEAISAGATEKLIDAIKPIAVFNGHSHRPCTKRWTHSSSSSSSSWFRSFTEWTVNSFSWRNGASPSLLMVTMSREKGSEPLVAVCHLPNELVCIVLYVIVGLIYLGYVFIFVRRKLYERRYNAVKMR